VVSWASGETGQIKESVLSTQKHMETPGLAELTIDGRFSAELMYLDSEDRSEVESTRLNDCVIKESTSQ